jgi:hypothetical protein
MNDGGLPLFYYKLQVIFGKKNNFQKRFGLKKRIKKNLALCVENVLKDQKSIGLLLLLQIQGVLCISIPQLLQI